MDLFFKRTECKKKIWWTVLARSQTAGEVRQSNLLNYILHLIALSSVPCGDNNQGLGQYGTILNEPGEAN